MKNFLTKLFLFVLAMAAANYAWIRLMPISKHVPHVWLMLVFFAGMTLVFHLLSLNAAKGRPQAFIRFYMGSTALRLCLYILVILIYRYYDKPTLTPFAVGFMAHYFLFTLFEVPILLQELKKDQGA